MVKLLVGADLDVSMIESINASTGTKKRHQHEADIQSDDDKLCSIVYSRSEEFLGTKTVNPV